MAAGEVGKVPSTAVAYSGTTVSMDPLSMLKRQSAAAAPAVEVPKAGVADLLPSSEQPSPAPKTREELHEDFIASQAPSKSAEEPFIPPSSLEPTPSPSTASKPGRIRITIQSREHTGGVTWYNLLVTDGSGERVIKKRYTDFKEFDDRVRKHSVCLTKVIPALPPGGIMGIRHKLDLGHFNDKRQEGLETWLASISQNAARSLLEVFVGKPDQPSAAVEVGNSSSEMETKSSGAMAD